MTLNINTFYFNQTYAILPNKRVFKFINLYSLFFVKNIHFSIPFPKYDKNAFGNLKFIYSEKATKFCEIFTLLLSYAVPVKSKVKISQNFVTFSEYMNFTINWQGAWHSSSVKNKERLFQFIKKFCNTTKWYDTTYLQNKVCR